MSTTLMLLGLDSFSITIPLPLSFLTYIVLILCDQISYHFLRDLDKQVANDYYSVLEFHDFKIFSYSICCFYYPFV